MVCLVSLAFRRVNFASGLMETAELLDLTGNSCFWQTLAAPNPASFDFALFRLDTLLLVTLGNCFSDQETFGSSSR
jgi:hypothetical protein